jgi:hypothetical protein
MATADGIDGRAVLFAYDGSEQARAAVGEAARQLGSDRPAVVLTAWEPLGAFPIARPEAFSAELEDAGEAKAQDVAREAPGSHGRPASPRRRSPGAGTRRGRRSWRRPTSTTRASS